MTRETARRLVLNNSRYRIVNGKIAIRDAALLKAIKNLQTTGNSMPAPEAMAAN